MTINEAIFTVITTKYKKDAKEAHKIIDEAGLEAYKSDGSYIVRNPENQKKVECNLNYGTIYLYSIGSNTRRIKPDQGDKIDFIAYLSTPWNMNYKEVLDRKYNYYGKAESKALQAYDRISYRKRAIKGCDEHIERIKKEMIRLQEDLIETVEDKANYEQEYKELLAQFGIKRA